LFLFLLSLQFCFGCTLTFTRITLTYLPCIFQPPFFW
jgi:hypothetical protein